MAEGNTSPESSITPDVSATTSAEKPAQTAIEKKIAGLSTRQKVIRALAAPLAALGLFGGATTGAEAATPAQNMVTGTEKVLGDPGQRMTAGAELVRDKGSDMASRQLDIQGEPGQKMADATLDVRDRGSDMAASQTDLQDKGSSIAGDQENIQGEPGQKMTADQEDTLDKGSDMAHDQEDLLTKDFAGSQERVQQTPGQKMADSTLDIRDRGSDMAHDQESNPGSLTPSENTSLMNPSDSISNKS